MTKEPDSKNFLAMGIMHDERKRCAGLVKVLHKEKDFLLYCIEQSVYPDQIEDFRKRFGEMQPDADIEDIL